MLFKGNTSRRKGAKMLVLELTSRVHYHQEQRSKMKSKEVFGSCIWDVNSQSCR